MCVCVSAVGVVICVHKFMCVLTLFCIYLAAQVSVCVGTVTMCSQL